MFKVMLPARTCSGSTNTRLTEIKSGIRECTEQTLGITRAVFNVHLNNRLGGIHSF
jgi:hypothetical protein